MGDASNAADLERFMRSDAGQARLGEIRGMLKGRTILEVSFTNEVGCIATTLHLDNGDTFVVFQPSLEVGAIRDEFPEVLQAEYEEEDMS